MRHLLGIFLLTYTLGGGGCDADPQANATANANSAPVQVPVYGYEVVNTFPHDAAAFTQGLVFHDGALVESTGIEGRSTLRRVELQTGKVLRKVDVPRYFFAEGLTLFGGKLYQLTWKGEKGFVYDPQSFQKSGEFPYEGEGWGLTHDADSLILSDGSDQIRFLDPDNFQVRRTINVSDRGRPVEELNELEYVKGEIYANVWHQDRVARIDPRTGQVKGWIDFAGLLRPGDTSDPEAVLNGIAYDERGDRLFVTGKLWPKLFEVRLRQK
ncbi:MAG TPA: glutaminyl-peptide cyclotransferase [Pyrinomonadaceae bacterium]|jgi:glutamine cyclotransferase